MELKPVYITLKKHLCSQYKNSNCAEIGLNDQNLIAWRSVMLTRLYQGIHCYMEEFPGFNLTYKEAIIHMLHEDANLVLRDLEQLPASLALKLLDRRLLLLDLSLAPDFQCVEGSMLQWLGDNRAWIARSHKEGVGLPELRWSDLPNELFPGLIGS